MQNAGNNRCCIYGFGCSWILDEIPVCVGYEIDGEVTTDFPVTHLLEKAKPVLKTLPGWKEISEESENTKIFRKIAVII